MATYKLSYFSIRGLAETARLLFALGGQKYEDFRFGFAKCATTGSYLHPEWDTAKADTTKYPFGKLPVLEVTENGHTTVVAQSKAIERLIAKRLGLLGSNDLEQARIEMVVEQVVDSRNAFYSASGKDEAVKTAGVTVEAEKTHSHKFGHEDLPKFLQSFETLLTNSGTGFFVGNKITLADVLFYAAFTNPSVPAAVVAKFALCSALIKKVETNDKIAEWIKNRPVTPF